MLYDGAVTQTEILSSSRARGIFAGITLNGLTLRQEDNQVLYSRAVTQTEILTGSLRHPAAARALYPLLNPYKTHK